MSNSSNENKVEVIEQLIDPVAQLTFNGLTYPIILPNADTDYIQKKLHSERVPYELDMLKDMQRRLSKGDSVLDIGANIGNHTLFLAVVAQCKVTAFEPNEALYGPLLKSIELNRLANRVRVRPVALGKVKGEGHFAKLVPENMGAQSITVGMGGIPIAPLDSFKFPQPIKAIKIDVEGMELDVLEGGIHRIKTDRPIIYVECQTEKEFRTIHDWFSKIDYGYWDTFNATPTHLFIPNERTTLDQRIARLQFKIVQDDYRLNIQLPAVRQKLEDAQIKYRTATEQITALKQQVAQAQASTQLKADLEAMRGRLDEANQKYRGATEQVTALKQQVAQAETARQAAQQAQAQASTQLKADLEAMRGRLDEANQKYRGATEQISALKHRATQEEAMQQGAEKVRAQAAAHLAEVQRSFQDEREVFQQQLAQLSQEGQAKTATVQEGEKKLIRLEAELEARFRLDEANQKYQAATEQVSRLTQQAKQEEAARKTAEQALQAAEVKLNGLDSELAALRTRLEEANQKYRGATEQISTLISDSNLRSEQNVTAPIEGAKTGSQLPDVHTVEYKNISYMQRQKPLNPASDQVFDGKPLISVIMTTYNTIDFIDAAVKSILNQTWKNLELIIIDDCSTDGTRQCAERYVQTDKRVRVFCFGENRGTYWCKNYGITLAAGVVITFMDSDDTCHEFRLEEQFAELNKKGRAMVTCNWVRKDLAGDLIVMNGVAERVAFISKMIKRRVIDEIGYFDTIRTSADDEFIKRVKLVYGNRAHFNIPKVLYTGAHRENSLTTDPENAINLSAARDSNVPILSPQRAHYGGSYVGWHKELVSKGMVPYMPFPVVNRPFPVYGRLRVKENQYDGNAISICVASFPSRKEQLKKTVLSIIDRVDAIYVYLNEYLEVPDFLHHPHVHATLGVNSKGDLRDNGKFYFFDQIPDGYCFTIDDDIDYPCDYFEALIRKIEFYDRKAVIGVHGTIFAKPIESYFKDRKLYHFRDELRRDAVVNQLDTGTVGFHTDLWRPSLEWFIHKGMADVFFAIEAKRRNITLIAMERPRGWLKSQDMSEGECRGLYEKFMGNDVVQTNLIKAEEPFDEVVRGELASHLAQRVSLGGPFLSKAVAIEKTDVDSTLGQSRAERISPESNRHDDSPRLTGKQLAGDFGKSPSGAITLTVDSHGWRVNSTLPDGKHEYLYATVDHSLEELGFTDRVKVCLDITPGLNIQLVIQFLDAKKKKISHILQHANRNQEAIIPPGTDRIRFGLRFYGGGNAEIKGMVLGHRSLQPAELIGKSEHLLLTNHYPSYDNLYRNAFIHTRVRAYHARGVRCDVFRLRHDDAVSYHEFEGVNVLSASQETLHQMLSSGQYKSVLVHFLSPAMWAVLQDHIDRIKVFVWVHGAEFQPWHRRDFDCQSEEQRVGAKVRSDKRMAFWRGLLQLVPSNLKLVFVSRYLAEEVMEDLGFRIPKAHYTVIHNPINTEVFRYENKSLDQRKKVLSISSYASRKYATDLNAKAIELLSNKPWFYDMEFRLIGDGPLFENTVASLREYKNVYIEQRFLKHDEIAALHKEYGVFLCSSRWDSHGVLRDEAMSSGLVPVTNAVAAIPEFVDETCGFLARQEDSAGLAEGIAKLYESPELFSAMSAAAAERVRRKRSSANTIGLELTLFAIDRSQMSYESSAGIRVA
jgi:FkbM family methyltransferase